MNKLEELKNECSEIDNMIDSLYEKKAKLNIEIRTLNLARLENIATVLGIKEGACIIGFSKEPDYHYKMVVYYEITDDDRLHHTFNAIVGSYRCDDNEYSAHIFKEKRSYAALEDIQSNFNIYVVDAAQLALLKQWMSTLEINEENISTYEALVGSNSISSVKLTDAS